ncbi:unnamed protein product [Trichobilharzia regenti]|nr:unnamed protein product [Trichobilharzia regenti]
MKDFIEKLSVRAVHTVFDYLCKTVQFTQTSTIIDVKKLALTYFGLRLLSKAVITIKEELSGYLVDLIVSYVPLDEEHINLWLYDLLVEVPRLSVDSGFGVAVRQHVFLKLFEKVKTNQYMTKSTILLLYRLSANILCILNNCPGKPSLYCTNNQNEPCLLNTSTGNHVESVENLSLYHHVEFLSHLYDNHDMEKAVEVLMNDFAVYLASHIRWNFLSTDQIRLYFTIILKNLHRFTPHIIRKIFSAASCNLSKANLNSWIIVHKFIVEFLCIQSNENSTNFSIVTLSEYHTMIYGALGCCLADRYADFMFSQQLHVDSQDFFCGRMSSETLSTGSPSVTSTQLIDLVVSILSALCRLGLLHQYMHAMFGAVYAQIQSIISLLCMPTAQVLRLGDHQLAQVDFLNAFVLLLYRFKFLHFGPRLRCLLASFLTGPKPG